MKIKLSNDTSPWARRLALYFIIYVGVIVIMQVVFGYFGFLHTDVDSARYMLSALVQGEAAIMALVVTLSLVAVQLAAQSYSARVIGVFRKAPDLWILMGIYGIAIFYGLGVLKLIERANPALNNLSNMEGHVAFSYYLGVFAFVALVPYIQKTLELLEPSTAINMLAGIISKQNILLSIQDDQEKLNAKDPFQPIIDIVRSSLMKSDYETVKEGLRAIGDRTYDIIKKEKFKEEEKENILKHLFYHLIRVGKLAANTEDEFSTGQVIFCLTDIAKTALELNLDSILEQAAISFRVVGISAAQKKLDGSMLAAAYQLRSIGIVAAEKKLEKITEKSAEFLGDIGVMAAEQKLESETTFIINWLEDVGLNATKYELEIAAMKSLNSLTEIQIIAEEQKLFTAVQKVKESIKEINKNLPKPK